MKWIICLTILFLVSSCGSLKINPRACSTDAVWGLSLNDTRIRDVYTYEKEDVLEFDVGMYLTLVNRNIRLKDLLEEHNLACNDLKKLRVEMNSYFFFIRQVKFKIVKK